MRVKSCGFALVLAATAGMLLLSTGKQSAVRGDSRSGLRKPIGEAQLLSVEPLPAAEGEMCVWIPASASGPAASAFRQPFVPQAAEPGQASRSTSVVLDNPPVRTVHDSFPTYSAVAVDVNSNEVYLQDENLTGYNVFNRLDNTPPTAKMTEPKRSVSGPKTRMDYNCAIYVDPKTGDVYSVDNDVVNTLSVFPRAAKGDVEPMRAIQIPHRGYGIGVDEENQELFLSIQSPPAVLAYRKTAKEDDAPLRILEGPKTMLADPHGVAVDAKNQWLFVANYGSFSLPRSGQFYTKFLKEPGAATWKPPGTNSDTGNMEPGSGQFRGPSISVYPLKANGDTAPLRVIQGPKTQMDWPSTLSIDPERGELFVANDMGESILVFSTDANADAQPKRVLKGPKTAIHNPTGLFADVKNQELWVANMGSHAATVYPLRAAGDTPPLRTIRSAPPGQSALMIGNPGAISYDSKRDELLVPN